MAARKSGVKRKKTARKTSSKRAPARKKTVKRKTAGKVKLRAPARKAAKAKKKRAIKQIPQRGAPKKGKPVSRARPSNPARVSELPSREQDKSVRPAAGVEELSAFNRPGASITAVQPGERTAANDSASDSRSDVDDVGGGLSPGLDKEG